MGCLLRDHPAHRGGRLLQNNITIAVNNLTDQIGFHQHPAVHHGGDGPHQLQRGQLESLAEGCGGQGSGAPLIGVGNQGFIKKYTLALPCQIDAGLFQNSKFLYIFIEFLAPQL